MRTKTMRQAEIFGHLDALETIANDHIIPFLANVAKALVTLVILGTKGLIKLSYLAAIFATNRVVANKQSTDTTDTDREIDVPVSIPISEDSGNTVDTEVEEAEQLPSRVTAINIYNPRANYLENFIAAGLRDTLAENYLNSVSYKLPKNNRVKTKTHIRYKDIGILKEHYPLILSTGILD